MKNQMQRIILLVALLSAYSIAMAVDYATVSGRIVDSNNSEALVGALIEQVNANRATATDINGEFTIKVPAGSTLEITYIGYNKQTIYVAGDMSGLHISLQKSGSWHSKSNFGSYLQKSKLFYQLEAYTNNLELNSILSIGSVFVNKAVPNLFLTGYTYDYMRLEDNGQKIIDTPNYASLKLKDLISWINVGGKIGWSGGLNSCFGVYGRFYFEHRRRRIALQHDSEYGYYWTNAIKPGIGVRFAPQFGDEDAVKPYLELGTTYTHILGCKTPYGKDKDQFGHGMTYSFGLGLTNLGDTQGTIYVVVELPRYDFLNKDWSNDGGYYFPYANIKDRQFRVTLNYSMDLQF